MAYKFSELAYIEACKPKAERNQWDMDYYLHCAKSISNVLIRNGIWEQSIYPVDSEGFMGGRGNR